MIDVLKQSSEVEHFRLSISLRIGFENIEEASGLKLASHTFIVALIVTIIEHCVTPPVALASRSHRRPHRKSVGTLRIHASRYRTDCHIEPLFITRQSTVAVVGIVLLAVST